MVRSRLPALVLLVAALVALSGAASLAPLGQRSADAPALTADASMRTFAMPPGYRVELVASEPLVVDPVFIDWDGDGRMWVVEMPAYMNDIRGTGEQAPTGRIVVLQDQDTDGRMDRRTVFADGLVLPRALKVLDTGVLVGEPPNLWLMRDTNGDLVADTRTLVTETYGRRDANVEHNANGLLWALDNWIYTSETDVFLRLRHGKFEIRNTLSRGQWGLSQDDGGRIYRNTNSSVLHVDVVPTPYYTRTAGLVRTRGSYESLANDDNDLNATFPSRPTPGVNRGYQVGVLRPDGRLASFTGVAAPTVYRGDRLPPDVYGNVFVAEPAGNLVSRIVLRTSDAGVTAERAYPDREFLTSTDERFRPVYVSSAPDGTLYIVDMYRGIIQHKGYITEYLRDQILSRHLEQPIAHGRVYRVMHESTRRGPNPGLSKASSAVLVRTLEHPNGWWRDAAQRVLVERGDVSAVPALQAMAARGSKPHVRVQALWTLEGLDQLSATLVIDALNDSSGDVRRSAVRLAEPWLRNGDGGLTTAVTSRLDDTSVEVRRQVAASLGELPLGVREQQLAVALERYGDDPIVMDAALSGMGTAGPSLMSVLRERNIETPLRRAALTMVAATLVRAGEESSVQAALSTIADPESALWQRDAILGGFEVALLNVTMPGSRGRRGGPPASDAPCNTCPGGRAGPGGAPAFPSAPAGRGGAVPNTNAGGRGTDGPRLRMAVKPAVADMPTTLPPDAAARLSAVLARIDWPGKAGAQTAAALTPAEQERFDAGKEVYEGLCQACHQPDGRGLDKVAPTLVGSALVNGSVEVLARVLLNGKEGTVGLMPPLGATLTDDQIAASLTYVRRAWGHTASAVDPAMVKKIRDATTGRTRPWTNEELATLK
jgi:mono/diheme cytochrome c family protein/glucose/arabinose dehydrogenase